MILDTFLATLNTQPESIEFSDTMAVIDNCYEFTASAFTNGKQKNAAGENSGSCKIFTFASINAFSEEQALACFGRYYRHDVLSFPEGSDHQNIRQFMISGWSGIIFEECALSKKRVHY